MKLSISKLVIVFLLGGVLHPALWAMEEGNNNNNNNNASPSFIPAQEVNSQITRESLMSQVASFSKSEMAFASEMNDIYRLTNVLELIHFPDKLSPIAQLKNISWQIDALSVYKRSLQDRFANALPWHLLAYMHHALDLPILKGERSEKIAKRLLPELPLLGERIKELLALEKDKFEILTLMKKLPHDVEEESREKGKFLVHMPLNTPNKRKLDAFQGNRLLTHEKKFHECSKIINNIINNQNCQVIWDQGQKTIKTQEDALKARSNLPPLALRNIESLIGALYEWETLSIISKNISALDFTQQSSLNLEAISHAIIMMGEALNSLSVNPKLLGLNPSEDVLQYRAPLKYLRNTFEHPEGYKAQKLSDLHANNNASSIFKAALEELRHVNTKLAKRFNKLTSFFTSQNFDVLLDDLIKSDPISDIEGSAIPTVPKRGVDLLKQPQWDKQDIPTLQMLRRYFLHPTYILDKIQESDEDLKNKANQVAKNEYQKAKLKGNNIKPEQILKELEYLETFLKIHQSKENLLISINSDLDKKLWLLHKLNRIYMYLDKKTQDEDLIFISSVPHFYYPTFCHGFFDLKERRNFNTHDLWRTDLIGTVNTAYRLIYDMKPILSILNQSTSPAQLSELDEELVRGLAENQLTYDDVTALIREGANLNAVDENFRTPLHHAVLNRNIEVVKLLLSLGATPHMVDKRGERPLHYAADQGNYKLAELLISFGALPDSKNHGGFTPFDKAKKRGHTKLSYYLKVQSGIFRGTTADALHVTIELKDFTQISSLINKGWGVNVLDYDGQTPLVLALEQEDQSPEEQQKTVDLLVKAGADVNKPQDLGQIYPLHQAAMYSRDYDLLKFLLSQGANVQVKNNCQQTPLHLAATLHILEFAQLLLDKGADIHARDHSENTPLLAAANSSECPPALLELLLKAGANPNDEDEDGTALHYIAERGTTDSVKLLLAHRADPFKKVKGGLYAQKLPIHVANSDEIKQVLETEMEKNPKEFEHYQTMEGFTEELDGMIDSYDDKEPSEGEDIIDESIFGNYQFTGDFAQDLENMSNIIKEKLSEEQDTSDESINSDDD